MTVISAWCPFQELKRLNPYQCRLLQDPWRSFRSILAQLDLERWLFKSWENQGVKPRKEVCEETSFKLFIIINKSKTPSLPN